MDKARKGALKKMAGQDPLEVEPPIDLTDVPDGTEIVNGVRQGDVGTWSRFAIKAGRREAAKRLARGEDYDAEDEDLGLLEKYPNLGALLKKFL